MKTNITLETDNLVLFPSAKNFAEALDAEEENFSDPMVDLMNEFSEMSDDQIPSYLDDRFEDDNEIEYEDEAPVFGSLEAFMARNQTQETITPDDKLVKLINDRLEAIGEMRARIKFYLDEIDMFLPRRK